MAAGRLLERWRTRLHRSSSKNNTNLPLIALPTDNGNRQKKDDVVEEEDDVLGGGRGIVDMFVKEENEKFHFKMTRREESDVAAPMVDGNLAVNDGVVYSESHVDGCVRRMLGREPALSHMMLTAGTLDPKKVMVLGQRAFGSSLLQSNATVAEVIVSLERAQGRSYKKDSRVWLHKHSSRRPRQDRTTTEHTTDENQRVPSPNHECEDDNTSTTTPPYQVVFPPTPVLSPEDISLDMSDDTLNDSQPPPYPIYDGYVSDGQEDYHSDYDDQEYENRVLGGYNNHNHNGGSRDDISYGRSPPPTETLEQRFNGMRGRPTYGYCDLSSDCRRSRSSDSPLVTRRSASDHQVMTGAHFQQRECQRMSVDDMMASDHQLPDVPTHEPSPDLRHSRGFNAPVGDDRRPHRIPGFYISKKKKVPTATLR